MGEDDHQHDDGALWCQPGHPDCVSVPEGTEHRSVPMAAAHDQEGHRVTVHLAERPIGAFAIVLEVADPTGPRRTYLDAGAAIHVGGELLTAGTMHLIDAETNAFRTGDV